MARLGATAHFAGRALGLVLAPNGEDEYSDLFWEIAAADDRAFELILQRSRGLAEGSLPRLRTLLHKATPRLAFTKLQLVRELLRLFDRASREILVQGIGYQNRRHVRGIYAGDFETMMADEVHRYRDTVETLPEDPELDDLVREVRRYL